ncbi:hypothetical protein D3C72_1179430 [compost metagenome]
MAGCRRFALWHSQVGGARLALRPFWHRGGQRGGRGAHKVLGVQVEQVLLGVVPQFGRFAHHAAVRGAGGSAVHLAKDDHAAEQGADVAGGVAHLHPARGRAAHAVSGDVLVVFAGVVPDELAVIDAGACVVTCVHQFDLHHALQCVQAGACHGGGGRFSVGPLLAHQAGVARTAHVARAGQQAACLVQANAVDQLAPQRAQGLGVQQDHALVLQPDAAVAGREEQAFADVGHGGVGVLADASGVKPAHRSRLGGQCQQPPGLASGGGGVGGAAVQVGQGDAASGHGVLRWLIRN